jgi:hypothetical protein
MVRHKVADYTAWRVVYDELEPLRRKHGCTDQKVLCFPHDPNDLLVTHDFPGTKQAEAFAHSPELQEGMSRAGVLGEPDVAIYITV